VEKINRYTTLFMASPRGSFFFIFVLLTHLGSSRLIHVHVKNRRCIMRVESRPDTDI